MTIRRMPIRLKVTKDLKAAPKFKFCADDPTLPGSPMVGYGETIAEAVGNWFIGNAEYASMTLELCEASEKHTKRSNAIKVGLHR